MAIKRIKAKNFKSFKELDLELGDLNILIGANASGKSNFVQIFKFLRDIRSHGLENAISIQGGAEYLTNVNIGASEAFSLEITSEPRVGSKIEMKEKVTEIKTYEVIYGFTIQFNDREAGFEILEDKLTEKVEIVEWQKNGEIGKTYDEAIVFSKAGSKVEINLPDSIPQSYGSWSRTLGTYLETEMLPNTLLLECPFIFSYAFFPSLAPFQSGVEFVDISVYDFEPKLARTLAPITGEVRLAENGNNLAIAIRNIIKSEDGKRKLLNLVTELLDFVDDLDVERRSIDRASILKIREKYSEEFLPVSLISDGTINMLALIIALYFDEKPLTIIEEPGRNIHPYLISRVVDMMEDASQSKQIIVTTHNPEMVRYANGEDLLLISRDEDGFSSISRPSEEEDMKIFLKNGLRMEDLYVESLLETL